MPVGRIWRDWLAVAVVSAIGARSTSASLSCEALELQVLATNGTPIAARGKSPHDIPFSAKYVYADAGWDSWADWLGSSRDASATGDVSTSARVFVRSAWIFEVSSPIGKPRLPLLGKRVSGRRIPSEHPTNAPANVYADAGWTGWGDWLGRREVRLHSTIADVVERHFDAPAARNGQGHATFFDSLAQTKHGPRTEPLPAL